MCYFLVQNVDSNNLNKAQKPLDIPDPEQVAASQRSTHGRAAKRGVAGQFVLVYMCKLQLYMACSDVLLSQCRLKHSSEAV